MSRCRHANVSGRPSACVARRNPDVAGAVLPNATRGSEYGRSEGVLPNVTGATHVGLRDRVVHGVHGWRRKLRAALDPTTPLFGVDLSLIPQPAASTAVTFGVLAGTPCQVAHAPSLGATLLRAGTHPSTRRVLGASINSDMQGRDTWEYWRSSCGYDTVVQHATASGAPQEGCSTGSPRDAGGDQSVAAQAPDDDDVTHSNSQTTSARVSPSPQSLSTTTNAAL